MGTYTFPLSVQITLPEDYQRSDDTKKRLTLIAERGLIGVEVNFADPEQLNPGELDSFLAEFGLKMTYFASGLTAKTFGLSLSSTDGSIRKESVRMVDAIISKLAGGDAGKGIIIGFFKGGPCTESEPRNLAFRESLREILPAAEQANVAICVEATNRYESCVANSLDGTRRLLDGLSAPALEILPDTFHMNIEESDRETALEKNKGFYRSIHLSDNNRFLPGFGALDFEKILRHLKRIGYAGAMALEGNIRTSFAADLIEVTNYLGDIQKRMENNE
jgi:D-psicose/D-tagatose/L-ribulose 3-epimerase